MEFPRAHRVQHVFSQHQVFDVGFGNHHALRASKAFDAAHVKIPFDFFVHSANGLNVTLLIDGSGDGDVLPQRES